MIIASEPGAGVSPVEEVARAASKPRAEIGCRV